MIQIGDLVKFEPQVDLDEEVAYGIVWKAKESAFPQCHRLYRVHFFAAITTGMAGYEWDSSAWYHELTLERYPFFIREKL
tara:strand:- start:1389 stop:1628 length:240 start_codon:yes stop_codon:yes gene_type:complete